MKDDSILPIVIVAILAVLILIAFVALWRRARAPHDS